MALLKNIFIGLLIIVVVNASSHTKCISLSNQKCTIQPTLINLHPNEYGQELHYYTFAVNYRCVGSCNTLNDLSEWHSEWSMCFRQNRTFKSKRFHHDCREKWIKNINEAYVIWI